MKFRVWCPERGQSEADGFDVDDIEFASAAERTAMDWYMRGDRFDRVTMRVRGGVLVRDVDVVAPRGMYVADVRIVEPTTTTEPTS